MWEMQGMLLYLAIEHVGKADRHEKVAEDMLIPYAHLIRDPRLNEEEAKQLAA